MSTKPELETVMTEVITEVIDDHPGPTMETACADAARAVIGALNLKLGSYFLDDNDENRPVARFYEVDGHLDVDGPPTRS